MGRNAMRLRRTQVRLERHRRRADRLVPLASRRIQMSTLCGVRRNPQDVDRQTAKIQAARSRQGGVIAMSEYPHDEEDPEERICSTLNNDRRVRRSDLFRAGGTAPESRPDSFPSVRNPGGPLDL